MCKDNETGRHHYYYLEVGMRVLRSYAAAIATAIAACLPISLRFACAYAFCLASVIINAIHCCHRK